MGIWVAIIAIGVLTFGIRFSLIALSGAIAMPARLQRALQFVPVAALTAIIAPELLLSHGTLDVSPGNARLVAGLVAVLVAWRTRNALLTIVLGMATLWLLQFALHVAGG